MSNAGEVKPSETELQEVYRQYPVLERARKEQQKSKEDQEKSWLEELRTGYYNYICNDPDDLEAVDFDKRGMPFRKICFSDIPVELLENSYEIWFEIVKIQGDYLLKVPKNLVDYKMIERAIESDGTVIKYIKQSKHDENLVKKAVTQNGMALQYVSFTWQTPEIIKIAFNQNVLAIQHAQFICIDLCDMVLKARKSLMGLVKPELFSKEIIAYLLSFDDVEIAKTIPLERIDKFVVNEVLNLK